MSYTSCGVCVALDRHNGKSTSKVRIGTKFSEKFLCSIEVRQGCVLSPNLFNISLEEIGSRKVEELTGGIVFKDCW